MSTQLWRASAMASITSGHITEPPNAVQWQVALSTGRTPSR